MSAMKIHLSINYEKHLFLLFTLLFSPSFNVASQEKTKPQVESYPVFSIPNTEVRTFHSVILNREMNIYIKLPSSYYVNSQMVYQTYYFTDANYAFPIVTSVLGLTDSLITKPELLIIGIGYKMRDQGDWLAWRTRDLTPTNVPAFDAYWAKTATGLTGRQYEVKTGGAETFLEFISKEVIPFVESNYRASSTGRGLGGYSLGGGFSLYVLFKHPELFSFYYSGSPSISYNKGILFNYENEYASSHKDLDAKLFMSMGGAEDSLSVSNMEKMAIVLKSRNYAGLTIESHVFPDEDHYSCIPSSLMRAFRVLYKR
jgi:predicted alpha/beta superfamily hydrolase